MSDTSADVFQISPPLSQGVGYGIVIGVGAIFAIGMSLTSWLLSRYMNEVQDSEMFMTAKHSVKSGLTASAVVSSWTIATTLLTSTTYGYQYGVAGPFWYAAAACVQILLFSVAAVELKRKAPNAQTFLQVVKLRYGTSVHLLYTAYSGVYQIINTVNLLVGGSAVFSSMSGVNRDAICYLFPVGVIIYTLMGGIKATFITDWVHTVMIYVIMLISLFVFYTTSSVAGSPSRVWELLKEASSLHPVDGNADGQYLTMRSQEGGYVGLNERLRDFLWSSNAYAAYALMGDGGVVAVLLMIFMAVTSAMSSETVATTALVTYNIYQAYIKPNASGRSLLYFSHFVTVGFAIFCSSIAVAFNHGGFSVGFLITAIGIFVDAAIVPMACTIMWRKQSKLAAFLTPIMGSIAGVLAWFLTTHSLYDVISVATLSENLPLVAGNIVALGSPLVLTPLLTFLRPEDFDWQIFKDGIKRGDDEQIQVPVDDESNKDPTRRTAREMHEEQEDEATLISARNRSIYLSIFLTLSLVILWPIPMYGTSYIFSSGFFTGWVAFLFIWAFLAAGIIVLLPIWEGKMQVYVLLKKVFGSPEELDSEPVTTLTLGELEDMTTSTTEKPPVDSAKAVV
ncbi:sodium/proline symporter [Penicillium chermesinum]|nr:sodium/proline symporter [Penicillium chermesinum]